MYSRLTSGWLGFELVNNNNNNGIMKVWNEIVNKKGKPKLLVSFALQNKVKPIRFIMTAVWDGLWMKYVNSFTPTMS